MKSKIGYYLMIIGAIIYFVMAIISYFYVPGMHQDFQAISNTMKLMTAIGFIGVIIFMIGSIVQIRESLK